MTDAVAYGSRPLTNMGWLAWAGSLPAWAGLAAISVTQTQIRVEDRFPDQTWWGHLYWQSPDWFLWAAVFAPVVYWLSGRVPTTAGWLRAVLVHLVLCAVTVASFTACYLPLKMLVTDRPVLLPVMFEQFATNYSERIRYDVMLYWAVLGVSTAVRQAETLHAHRLREADFRAELSEARLSALNAQLQPHFLFNTHNSIVALARQQDHAGVERLVLRLSDLLRQTLGLGSVRFVTLEDELEMIASYLDIERVRFGDRLRAEYLVPTDLLNHLVPPFVLQPLVENAIKHGLGSLDGPSRLTISAEMQNADLCMSVWNAPTPRDTPTHLPGTGLSTLRARLSTLYDSHEVHASAVADGYRVVVRLGQELKAD